MKIGTDNRYRRYILKMYRYPHSRYFFAKYISIDIVVTFKVPSA